MAESLNRKKPAKGAAASASAGSGSSESIDIAEIKNLFILMRENDIAELNIEQAETRIHIVSKGCQQVVPMMSVPSMPMMNVQGQAPAVQQASVAPAAPAAPARQDAAPPEPAEPDNGIPANARVITSPMVGTFYRSPSPESPVFVHEGDDVGEDTVLCIIEAMKLMNEIKAETRGRIVKVLVENGMPVEFGQPLFAIVP